MQLREKLPPKTNTLVGVVGAAIIVALWALATESGWMPQSILPSPFKVLYAFVDLHYKDALIDNAVQSIKLNLLGLTEAVVLAWPIGLVIGLSPILRAVFERHITVIRFLPLTAVVGLFIVWFGIEDNMKVQFLAISIFVYLLPAIIQRVDDVEDVYIQTITTLNADKIQTIRKVYLPAVISRSFDDIRNLAAISWTYIVVAEMVNSNGGGLGAMSYLASRQSRIDKVFALLMVIILIGFLQDKLLILMDKILFPHKYAKKGV